MSTKITQWQIISISSKLALTLGVCVLSACGDNGGVSTSAESIVTGGSTSTTTAATSVGSTAGATEGATAGAADGSTPATMAGSTAGETDESTASTTQDATNEDVGDTAVEATAGDSDLAPVVRAPTDAQIRVSDSLELDGSVALDKSVMGTPIIQWEQLSGPGLAVFSDSQSAVTAVRFDDVGVYELELSAIYAGFNSADTMQVVVNSDIINQAPVVNAGADTTLELDEVVNLTAQVDDDGLPNASLAGRWSKVSGPGTVTFGELTANNTTASFNTAGVFVLRFTSSDGALSDSDSIRVSVNATTPVTPTGNNINAANAWQDVITSNGSKPQGRHEAGAVAYQNQLYLMGGRGQRQVNRYNPANNRWENLGVPSMELNHFQPVEHNGKIYIIGALDCCFPSESVVPRIQIFNPGTKTWSQGATLPTNRRRGSAGVVVYNNKIYLVGGSTNGHDAGMVNWFDEYNPANNQWKTLPNAPTKRDHFKAAVVGSKLIAAGGRQTDHPKTFANLVSNVDVYNFSTGKWTNGAPIPTKRAGAMTVSHGDEVIVIGGESNQGKEALKTVEAYNVTTNKWRTLKSLKIERHSGGAAIVGNAIHVVSGNTTTGGGNESQSHEKLDLN